MIARRHALLLSISVASIGLLAPVAQHSASAAISPQAAQKLYKDVTPSLVAVQYVWQSELGRRELVGAGIVVGDEGLVMAPLTLFNSSIPDAQMTEFKIIVPRENGDPDEFDAIFQGRDERTNLAFIKTKEPQKWKSVKFEDAALDVGDVVTSVGILPKSAGYKSYYMDATVSANLRGETPQVLVSGGLASVGAPVFNEQGKAVGLVVYQAGQSLLLNNSSESLNGIISPPRFFVPSRDFLQSFSDLPTPTHQIAMPWIGVPQLTGLNKDVAEAFDLKDVPAIQVGDVIKDQPGEKAGLKRGDIIVKVNGKALERGDEPTELPMIFRRALIRMKPGEVVTLSVLRGKGEPLTDVKVTLGDQPGRANTAKRWFADDLGFAVRDMVFLDSYARKLPPDSKGVVVALMRPQSSAASGGLRHDDLVQSLNGEPVTGVEDFQKKYETLRKDKPREAVVLVVVREGHEDTIRIEPPQ